MKNAIVIICILLCINLNLKGQQIIDNYITDSALNVFKLIGNSSNSITSPIDLDFYPNQSTRPNELWILNQGTINTGGNTVIITNPNSSNKTFKYIKDGNAWHFMAMSSSIAFGDTTFVTSQDIIDANRNNGIYAGPTLWPSNLKIYGIVGNPATQANNGSHLSMIHQSPYGKGVAHEKDAIYWIMDGYEGKLKRYDFGAGHYPGGDDHSLGYVSIYDDFSFTKHSTLPSHIVLDEKKEFLYGCDPVAKRVFKIDITKTVKGSARTMVNFEDLVGYDNYSGLKITNLSINNLVLPTGIDIYGNRLIITDNGTDEIIIFDLINLKEIGRIKLKYTANPDPIGVKIGPDGKIYFVDKLNRQAYIIDNSKVWSLNVENSEIQNKVNIYPNPSNSEWNIELDENVKSYSYKVVNILGEEVINNTIANENRFNINNQQLSNGVYFLQLKINDTYITKKLIKI